MYLARKRIEGAVHFFIRESFRDGELIRSRDLFCLGSDPSRYIVYPGGNAFYIDDTITETLSDLNVESSPEELDDIFWPFLNPRLRNILEPFREKASSRACRKECSENTETTVAVHHFDRRRICFLKCGHITGRTASRLPQALFRGLIEKSRDEIEQHFVAQEFYLNPSELRTYAYAVFDLQRFFSESFAREHPQWLDQEKLEKCFIEEVCRLHDDPSFWAGKNVGESIHRYLRRYVIMFFDNAYERRSPLEDYARDFMNRHRFRRNAPARGTVSMDQASVVFGVKKETLDAMTKRGLTRYYRLLAKKLHPDKGGSQEKFVELTEIYRALLKKKGM